MIAPLRRKGLFAVPLHSQVVSLNHFPICSLPPVSLLVSWAQTLPPEFSASDHSDTGKTNENLTLVNNIFKKNLEFFVWCISSKISAWDLHANGSFSISETCSSSRAPCLRACRPLLPLQGRFLVVSLGSSLPPINSHSPITFATCFPAFLASPHSSTPVLLPPSRLLSSYLIALVASSLSA